MKDLLLMLFFATLALVVFSAIFVAVIIYGTSVRNKWGINVKRVSCPQCKTKLPLWRIPKSLHEGLWGGWTCHVCGTRIDKWGRVRDEQ
jgi:hypothetical protein